MNLEAYLEQLNQDCQPHSRGTFSLTLDHMVSRLSQSLVVDPELAPLFLVAAAVHLGAHHLEVQLDPKLVNYRFDMAEPDLSGGQSLLGDSGQESGARWLILAMAAQTKPTYLLCPEQGRKLSLGPNTCEVEPWKPKDPDRRITVQVASPKGTGSVPEILRRHASLCPVPLKLQGQLLQKDLTLSYRGSPMAWSTRVPPLLCPSQPGGLTTPLALFLARTRASMPTWVAVVGGISYPFLLPEARGVVGVIWSDQLRTDVSLNKVVQDDAWARTRSQVLEATHEQPYQ